MFTTNSKSQIVNIPDANFKAKLLEANVSNTIAKNLLGNYFKIDANNDGEIQTSESAQVSYLWIPSSNIVDLTGISSFNWISTLNLAGNQIVSLDVSALTHLYYFYCNNNQLTSLTLGNHDVLNTFNCQFNQLTNLDVTTFENLVKLDCRGNNLNSLNVSNLLLLQELRCADNELTEIDLTGLNSIVNLSCGDNQLTSLNVANLTSLYYLYCSNNQISSLNLSLLSNLKRLNCSFNNISSLNVNQLANLEELDCSYNLLNTIDVSGMPQLSFFYCSVNQISELNLTNTPLLGTLFCSENPLTTLDLSQNHFMSSLYVENCPIEYINLKNGSHEAEVIISGDNNLQYICADDDEIVDIEDFVAFFNLTNCHVNSYCSFVPGGAFYSINGNNRFDNNHNGCDSDDISYPNLKLNFANNGISSSLIPDANGTYKYDVQAGTHSFLPVLENPTYFNVSPTAASVTFPATASPFIQDFCVTANGTHNDLEATLLPIGPARPGFDANYKIVYKNKGTAMQSGTVNLTFDDTVVDLMVSNPIVNSQSNNNLAWEFSNLQPFETREITLTLNVNSPMESPAVNSGDILNYTATITGATDETPTDNASTLNQTVVNSYDPNDKTCLEGTTITPNMVGQYVHYIIRFENTGTFAAENIVIADIIDSAKFDLSTLIPQSSSHSFVTRINNTTNKVEFIFENINLPFDDANNDGYVAFKIKTKPTLVVGDTFSNTANIYFDYNFPITTNTYVTTVQTLGHQDFEFSNVFSLSPVPTKEVLTITAKESVVMTSVSIYNTLGQLVQVHTNPNESIDISGLSSGNYFIKVISDKGSSTGKFIKE